MKRYLLWSRVLVAGVMLASGLPMVGLSQETKAVPVFKVEELDQMLAPIALYPDTLLPQIFIAATYPLEVVQAARWAKDKSGLSGAALTAALEKESWDASVKSLVGCPQVLTMMSEKLDWTQKLGDAFLSQQKDVLASVQRLRNKAREKGNLETTAEQKVTVEESNVIIEPVNPEVIYVPVYNPTLIYGDWWYPSYPPYYYYPPGYAVMTPTMLYSSGIALGVAWGYAWGHCDWHGGDVDIDVDRNVRVNPNIDRAEARQKLQEKGYTGKGEWRHDPEHRKGVSYRDPGTAGQYGRMASPDAIKNREEFRGRAESVASEAARSAAGNGAREVARERVGAQAGAAAGVQSARANVGQARANVGQAQDNISRAQTAGNSARNVSQAKSSVSAASAQRSNAFDGMGSGSATRNYSAQGKSSRSSMSQSVSSGARSSGGASRGGGGAARGGGGGRR